MKNYAPESAWEAKEIAIGKKNRSGAIEAHQQVFLSKVGVIAGYHCQSAGTADSRSSFNRLTPQWRRGQMQQFSMIIYAFLMLLASLPFW